MQQRVTLAKAILAICALQTAQPLFAQQRDPLAQLFPSQPAGYVTDVPRALDAASVERIREVAERLRNATGAELAVVVLPTIGDRAAVDVAVAIGRAWGVGAKAAIGDQRRNAGIVVLLVPKRQDDPNSGQVFIATGQGLEGIVTDLQAGRVRDLMRPAFQRGEYGAGLEQGVRALAGLIAQGLGVSDSALAAGARQLDRPQRISSGTKMRLFFWAVIIAIILLQAILSNRGGRGGRRRRGPGPWIFWGGGGPGGLGGGGFGGGGGGFGGGGFGGFGGGGGFSGGGAGGRF